MPQGQVCARHLVFESKATNCERKACPGDEHCPHEPACLEAGEQFTSLSQWAASRVDLLMRRELELGRARSSFANLGQVLAGEVGDAEFRTEIRGLLQLMAESHAPESEPEESTNP